ncbi:MAG: hypothetical protein KJ057_09490 [Phycisphaerae bacterium]|nr:hypothetical protein [Phycisphaerae bacterium]NUQ10075.1 hypothetical protein [Phycisphaerae bacterium]
MKLRILLLLAVLICFPGCFDLPLMDSNTCRFAFDGECDDGGTGATNSLCAYGSDLADCGPRFSGGGGSNDNSSDDDTDVSGIPSETTLAAAAAKRFEFYGAEGDTVIFDATMPDDEADVDLFLYDPSNSTVGSSTNLRGLPDNIRHDLTRSGTYALECVNVFEDRSVTVFLRKQVLSDAAGNDLSGVYRITEYNGGAVPDGQIEKFAFDQGRLVSRYIFLDASLLGLGSDLEVWVDHRPGEVTDVYWEGQHYQVSALDSSSSSDGASLSFTYDIRIRLISGSQVYTSADGSVSFSGSVSGDGRTITGIREGLLTGDLSLEFSHTLTARRE